MNNLSFINNQFGPKITSAGKTLIFTESICFYENEGMELTIPTEQPGKNITIQFVYNIDTALSHSPIKVEIINASIMRISLTNFSNPLGTTTTVPLECNIGNVPHQIFIYAHGIKNSSHPDKTVINMTFSMFRKGI